MLRTWMCLLLASGALGCANRLAALSLGPPEEPTYDHEEGCFTKIEAKRLARSRDEEDGCALWLDRARVPSGSVPDVPSDEGTFSLAYSTTAAFPDECCYGWYRVYACPIYVAPPIQH